MSVREKIDNVIRTVPDFPKNGINFKDITSLLFAFGSGPIRGFSITLSLGVIASMFTALMLTNFLVYMYLSFANKKELKF